MAGGGWSDRQTLFGGDQFHSRGEGRLDPATSPARIRAFYVHPDHARRGHATRLPGEPLYRALGYVPDAGVDYPMPGETTLPLSPMTKVIA